jgi:hypothetical protein
LRRAKKEIREGDVALTAMRCAVIAWGLAAVALSGCVLYPTKPGPVDPSLAGQSPVDGDVSIGGRAGGSVNGDRAYVVEGKLYAGIARWPKKGAFPSYLSVGAMATLGKSGLDPCDAPCPAAFTGSIGPEARAGFVAMFDNEGTHRRAPAVIAFVAAAPSVRVAKDVETHESGNRFVVRISAGVSFPISYASYTSRWHSAKHDFEDYLLPNHFELVHELAATTYLVHGSSWGAAIGYSF